MTYRDAVRQFKEAYHDLYEQCADYWLAQLAWSEWTDILCKSGDITQKQFNTWKTPFPYGKHLKPIRT